jgi:hypothetical protein
MGLKLLGQIVIKLFGLNYLINGGVRHLFWPRGAVKNCWDTKCVVKGGSLGTTAVTFVLFQLWAFFKLKWRLLASVFFNIAYILKLIPSTSILSNSVSHLPVLLDFLFPQTCQIELESVFRNIWWWSVFLKIVSFRKSVMGPYPPIRNITPVEVWVRQQ